VAVCAGIGLLLNHGRAPARAARLNVQTAAQVQSLPPPPAGFAIPKPTLLTVPKGETRWAPVIEATVARRAPSSHSPGIVRVLMRTPEGTSNLVVATGEVVRDGVAWVRAELAMLPNGTAGWLPRSALGGWSFVDAHVVVDRRRLTLTLYRAGRVIFRAPVGVGTPTDPTAAGTFYIRDRLTSFASPEYGPIAFGTSARAPYLTDWPAGGYIGIHGTDQPQLIPGHVSHGCIRLTDQAILELARLMPVGTPVTVT
jgi:hypothetical protein